MYFKGDHGGLYLCFSPTGLHTCFLLICLFQGYPLDSNVWVLSWITMFLKMACGLPCVWLALSAQ